MNGIPQPAYVVLATGIITILTTILTNYFLIRIESKKALREEAREARKREDERASKQREIKASKLAELWMAIELARERLIDAEIKVNTSDQILLPPSRELASSASSQAYGVALLHFPDVRQIIYRYHVEVVKYEAGLWFQKLDDTDAAIDRVNNLRVELADSVEKMARDLHGI